MLNVKALAEIRGAILASEVCVWNAKPFHHTPLRAEWLRLSEVMERHGHSDEAVRMQKLADFYAPQPPKKKWFRK